MTGIEKMADERRFAEEKWAEVQFENLRRSLEEIKTIALIAKKRAESRDCPNDGLVKEIQMNVNSWTKWWRGAMITILAGLVTAVGFAWKVNDRAADMEKGVDDVNVSVDGVTRKMATVMKTQEELQSAIQDQGYANIEDNQVLKEHLKEAVIEAIRETRGSRRGR